MPEKTTTENYKYFQHRECEFFPCHENADPESFNCLFCYCPLYTLKDKCGGDFEYMEGSGIKDCSNCLIPHRSEGFDYIMNKWPEVRDAAKLDAAPEYALDDELK